MRVSVVQLNPRFGEVEANVNTALGLMDTVRADLYVLPELFSTGYNFANKTEVRSLAEPADQGRAAQALKTFAKQQGCYVVYGFAEEDRGALYNSAALIGPSGTLGVYRKVHLYDRENLFFEPGDLGFPVFDTPFGKIGMMICFDWIYPESARALALKGAQLIAHPSNLVMPYCPDAMVTRCLENRVLAATADRVGVEDRGGFRLTYIGTSEIISPGGEILVRLSTDREEIAFVDIDPTLARSKRINPYNDLLADRKTKYYS
jgi:predicted amidohydrolase